LQASLPVCFKLIRYYDGAGTNGWLACLATSKDLTNWTKLGPVLQLGNTNEDDSKSASHGTTFFDGTKWQMFYLGKRHVLPAPNLIPATLYVSMKAFTPSPSGPWTKQPKVVPFRCQPGTYFSDTASECQCPTAASAKTCQMARLSKNWCAKSSAE